MNDQTRLSAHMYSSYRKATGCPPVVMMDLGRGNFFVETKDGSARIEEVSDACNSWEAKIQCIDEWVRRKEQIEAIQ